MIILIISMITCSQSHYVVCSPNKTLLVVFVSPIIGVAGNIVNNRNCVWLNYFKMLPK